MPLKTIEQEARLVSDLPPHYGMDKNLLSLSQMEPQTSVPQPSQRYELNVKHLIPQ